MLIVDIYSNTKYSHLRSYFSALYSFTQWKYIDFMVTAKVLKLLIQSSTW